MNRIWFNDSGFSNGGSPVVIIGFNIFQSFHGRFWLGWFGIFGLYLGGTPMTLETSSAWQVFANKGLWGGRGGKFHSCVWPCFPCVYAYNGQPFAHEHTHTHINMYNIHVRVCARYMSLDSLERNHTHTHIYIYYIWATVQTPAILNMYSTDIGLWKLMEIVKNTR